MDVITSLAIVGFAALVHASFQLSVGVLTLLSGHAIGARRSRQRLTALTTSYIAGAGIMTLLTLSFVSLILLHSFPGGVPLMAWAIACAVLVGIGIGVWLFYYRRSSKGTELWIPRSFADFLQRRSKATRHSAEAFSLGLTSVVAEIIFILPPITIAALVLLELPSPWQLVGILVYAVVSLLGLILTWSLIGRGKSLARMQKWRTKNKGFLQFAAGSAMIILGFFVYVSEIIATTSGAL